MATFSQFFPWLDFFYGKNKDQSCRGNFYRGRRLRPLVTFHSVAVAEVGDKNLSHSPTSAAGYFFRLLQQRGLVFFFPVGTLQVPTYLLFSKVLVFFFSLRWKKTLSLFYWNLRAQFLNKFYFFCQDWYVSTGRETAGLIRWSSNLTVCFPYLAVTSYLRFATCLFQKLSVSNFWFSQRFESWFALFWNMSRYCFACEEADLKITSTKKIYEWHGKSIILVI